jgi:hypothetical protein
MKIQTLFCLFSPLILSTSAMVCMDADNDQKDTYFDPDYNDPQDLNNPNFEFERVIARLQEKERSQAPQQPSTNTTLSAVVSANQPDPDLND